MAIKLGVVVTSRDHTPDGAMAGAGKNAMDK